MQAELGFSQVGMPFIWPEEKLENIQNNWDHTSDLTAYFTDITPSPIFYTNHICNICMFKMSLPPQHLPYDTYHITMTIFKATFEVFWLPNLTSP